jgi:hypothetical protein
MRSSRISSAVSLSLAAGLTLLVAVPNALARDATIKVVSPQAEAEMQAQPTLPDVPVVLVKPPRGRDATFEASELKAPDPNAVGVLDDKQGSFGVDMWEGTSAATVRRFLPSLPAATPSRAMRGLMRRLLLTAAAPADGGQNAQNAQTPSLLLLRAERLYAMGEMDGLTQLLRAAPVALMNPALQRMKVDALLLGGDTAAACAEMPAVQGGPADATLAKMQVLCPLVSGRTMEGKFGIDLMRERKDADNAFIAAAEVLGGLPPGNVDKLPNLAPIHIAAFRAAKMSLPADTANTTQPALLRAVALSPNAPVEVRLLAAERAEAVGALDADSLRQLYASLTFTPAELQAAVQGGDKNAKARWLLFRVAQLENQPVLRSEAITKALKSAADRNAYAAAARLYAPLMVEIKPAAELAGFAPVAARALYAAGRADMAANWLAVAAANADTAKDAAALWPLARLSTGRDDKPTPPSVIEAWRTAKDLPPDQAERRAAVGLALVSAVGEPVPAAQWLSLLDGPLLAVAPGPRPALKAMLRSATEGLHVGETVLLSLAALGETGLDKADPDTLNRVVVALRQVGLDHEARDLAVEAALANGI